MPLIRDSTGRKDDNSGYARLFGSSELGRLLSRVQATVIRAGKELELLLHRKTPYRIELPLDAVLESISREQRIGREVIYNASFADLPGYRADFVILDHDRKLAYIVEVKDGDTFDTKKASGELHSLRTFADHLAQKADYFVEYYFCSFNQTSKFAIIMGTKKRFNENQVMIGREFAELIGVDYEEIIAERRAQQKRICTISLANFSKFQRFENGYRDI